MASIFSRIVEGSIPCYFVAENEEYMAFLDINPVAKGHTLVIPKKETDYVFDLPDNEFSGLMLFARETAKAIDKALSPIRTGVIVEGLEVSHAHIHLIPIYDSGQKVALGHGKPFPPEEMASIAQKINQAFNS